MREERAEHKAQRRADEEPQQRAAQGIERRLDQHADQRWPVATRRLRERLGDFPQMRQRALVEIENQLDQLPGNGKRQDDQDDGEGRCDAAGRPCRRKCNIHWPVSLAKRRAVVKCGDDVTHLSTCQRHGHSVVAILRSTGTFA